MHVILLGPPGAGKGTQAKLIEQKFNMPHISTGDLLRAAVRDGTSIGLQAKEYMERGQLVPDAVVIEMIEQRMAQSDTNGGFLLDGFPRNVRQAAELESMLQRHSVRIDQVLSLDVPRAELLRRLTGRRTCRGCNAMYHVAFEPPKKEGICDRCGAELYQREDDREETISSRLDVYDRDTAPVKDFYRERQLLRDIAGVGGRAEIFATICNHLKSRPGGKS